jgi:hypothetical protein
MLITNVLKNLAVAMLAIAPLSLSESQAAILFTTDFSAPTYSDGGLIGQDSWVLTNSTTNPITVSDSATDGIVTIGASGQDVRRAFAAADTGSSVFLGAIVNLTSSSALVTTNGDYFINLGDNTTSGFFARVYARSSGAGFQLALTTSSVPNLVVIPAASFGAELPFGTPFSLLARYDFVSGLANDTGALFINPIDRLGVGDTAYSTAFTTGTDATSISSVSLRQGSTTPVGTISSIFVDGAVAVPEPTSMALLCMTGAVGLAVGYRRKKVASQTV